MEDSDENVREVEELVELFGSHTKLALAFGVGRSTVSMWKRNGIPAERRIELLGIADRKGLRLPDWVIPRTTGVLSSSRSAECAV